MKIIMCSDIHLEFGEFCLEKAPVADVLVLAGDIFVGINLLYLKYPELAQKSEFDKAQTFYTFVEKCCHQYSRVIFVMGNHEHYLGTFNVTAKFIHDTFEAFNNFHLLDDAYVLVENVVFVGGTLWTDMNNEDEETINMAQECINDYNLINVYKKEIKKKLSPEDTIALHKHTLRYLQKVISTFESKKVVVVTHHAPSKNSLKCPEDPSDLINGVYSSNLDEFIESHPNIKLWIHGHIHSYHNYTIGSTQVICNPRGYIGYENISKNFEWKVVEI